MKQLAVIFFLVTLAAPVTAQDYEITRWTIASGGTMESSGGDWSLKGTIGQWEATKPRELSGDQWRLTGGFWSALLQELEDLLFQDRFEDESS